MAQDDPFSGGNSLLAACSRKDRELLRHGIQSVTLRAGKILFSAGQEVHTAYFPVASTTIALSINLFDGREVLGALIGSEGAVGGIVSGGHIPAFGHAEVETGGTVLTMSHIHLKRAKGRSANLTDLFARYSDCLLAQSVQTSACNAYHSVEQRLARWLSFLCERRSTTDIPITQERLGTIIGAHRVTVLRAIALLQTEQLVELRRQVVRIVDPPALARRACECHSAIERHYLRMLPRWQPIRHADV